MHTKFLEIEAELASILYERDEVVRGVIVALLARQHVFLLGPPGTGKSMLLDELLARIQGDVRRFKWQLTKFTEPDEILGSIDAKRFVETGVRKRVTTGRLPDAEFAFIDEIWKANSAILNTLLGIFNERFFLDADGTVVPVPLRTVLCASNEVPTDKEELAAIWDRILLTYWVPRLQERANRGRLCLTGGLPPPKPQVTISGADIEQAQREVFEIRQKGLSPEVVDLRLKIQEELEDAGDGGIFASDRRWGQSWFACAAMAWLAGRKEILPDDLEILVPCLWRVPGERRIVTDKVLGFCFPALQQALDLQDMASEQFKVCMAHGVAPDVRFEAYEKLKSIGKDAEALKLRDRNPRIVRVCEKIIEMRKRGSEEVVGA